MAESSSSVPEITSYDKPLLSTPATVPDGVNIFSMFLALLAGRRDASLILNEDSVLQMKDYRQTYGYLFPVVVTESLWNLAVVVLSVVALFWIAREESNVMLRVWICGYSVHCVVNVVLLVREYVKRNDTRVRRVSTDPNAPVPGLTIGSSSSEGDGGDLRPVPRHLRPVPPSSWDKLNPVVSCLWWVLGFIFMVVSYNNGATPCLFWLTVAYLAMDVFLLVLTIVMFCSIW